MDESGASGGQLEDPDGGCGLSGRHPPERYWLVHANGGRQLIDPERFDLTRVAEQARRKGGRLEAAAEIEVGPETVAVRPAPESTGPALSVGRLDRPPMRFEPPISALGPLFKVRLDKVYRCLVPFDVDVNTRPTTRVLGGYYKSRRLVRVYSHDTQLGRRPLEELFDTFLHEVAHHVEYTEPDSFHARECERVHGRMHSNLFWRILGELKGRWADLQREVTDGRGVAPPGRRSRRPVTRRRPAGVIRP